MDFDEPIKMTSRQRERFISFMKTLFSVIKEERTNKIRTERMGDKIFMRKWDYDEYELLLEVETKDTEKVAEELGRTWMSVDIKRGSFVPEYLYWAEREGKDLLREDTKKLIKEFMKTKEDLKRKRSEIRKMETRLRKSKEKLHILKKKEAAQREIVKSLSGKRISNSMIDSEYNKLEKIRVKIRNMEKVIEARRKDDVRNGPRVF